MSSSQMAAPPRRMVPPGAVAPAFSDIICGIDGTHTAYEAARQAAVLTGPHGSLSLVAVAWRAGEGIHQVADLSPDHAKRALGKAASMARELGANVTTTVEEGRTTADLLLERSRNHDLLVLGHPAFPRAGGILLGSVASTAVHSAEVPVLLARPAPGAFPFPKRIVLASDGSMESRRLVELSVRIAEAHDARVTLLHVSGPESAHHPRDIAEQATQLYEWLKVEPIVRTEHGRAHERIVDVANREQASLVVVGSRGLTGVHALASVSERVAHHATCSVLLVRPNRSHDRLATS
jgi:nucleotide-binding universal stress UspA family protein